MDNHLVDFEFLKEWEEYEDHIYFGGAMSVVENKKYEFNFYLEVLELDR